MELPEGLKKELSELEAQLKINSPSIVRWVDPGSIHITLKFLGEVPEESIEELELAIEESVPGVEPFKLGISEVGAFPSLNHPQVIWVGVRGDLSQITHLQKKVEENTVKLGFPRERREFTPHLTLGRVRDEATLNELKRLTKLLIGTNFTAIHDIDVDAVNLMKSQLTPNGAIYTCLKKVKLGNV